MKTSALTFNENTGIAQTKAAIEFRVPEGNGSAVGATYDSHGGVLTLKSAVKITSTGQRKATITGQSAIITKNPSKIVLQSAKVEEPQRIISADKVTVFMSDDNNIERIVGSGNLHASSTGAKAFEISAPEGELGDGRRKPGAFRRSLSAVLPLPVKAIRLLKAQPERFYLRLGRQIA